MMDNKRGALRAFKHQITQVSVDRQDLTAIVDRLAQTKQDISLHIQLVHFELRINAHQKVAVDIKIVAETNHVAKVTLY